MNHFYMDDRKLTSQAYFIPLPGFSSYPPPTPPSLDLQSQKKYHSVKLFSNQLPLCFTWVSLENIHALRFQRFVSVQPTEQRSIIVLYIKLQIRKRKHFF